jgi:hypothetical protein
VHQLDAEHEDVRGIHGPFGKGADLFRICALTIFLTNEKSNGLATARDASGYMAALFTRGNFGCVQFSALPPQAD